MCDSALKVSVCHRGGWGEMRGVCVCVGGGSDRAEHAVSCFSEPSRTGFRVLVHPSRMIYILTSTRVCVCVCDKGIPEFS